MLLIWKDFLYKKNGFGHTNKCRTVLKIKHIYILLQDAEKKGIGYENEEMEAEENENEMEN